MGGVGASRVGFGGFFLGIQEVILNRSRKYGMMTSKSWVVLGRRTNNSGCSSENQGEHTVPRPEVLGSKSKESHQWILGRKRILREDLGSVKARR